MPEQGRSEDFQRQDQVARARELRFGRAVSCDLMLVDASSDEFSEVGGVRLDGEPHVLVEQMMLEVAENVTGMVVSGAAHWIPEETPELFSAAVLEFLAAADRHRRGERPAQ